MWYMPPSSPRPLRPPSWKALWLLMWKTTAQHGPGWHCSLLSLREEAIVNLSDLHPSLCYFYMHYRVICTCRARVPWKDFYWAYETYRYLYFRKDNTDLITTYVMSNDLRLFLPWSTAAAIYCSCCSADCGSFTGVLSFLLEWFVILLHHHTIKKQLM